LKCRFEHLIYLFVLGPEENIYLSRTIFTVEELNEIKKANPIKHLQLDESIAEYLLNYQATKCNTMPRCTLFENYQFQKKKKKKNSQGLANVGPTVL
jgi:hypothetical protein